MRAPIFRRSLGTATLVGVCALTFGGSARAATRTVCPSGCSYASVQAAFDAAQAGDEVILAVNGSFIENGIVAPAIPVELHGFGASVTKLKAAVTYDTGAGRILTVPPGGELTIRNLGLLFGDAAGDGGGILNNGHLMLDQVDVLGNRAVNGGGIFNAGALEMAGSEVNGYLTSGSGGALYNAPGASLSAYGCRIHGAALSGDGGALYNEGTAHLQRTDVDSSEALNGGGIANVGGSLTLEELRLLSNTAQSSGGGLFQDLPASQTQFTRGETSDSHAGAGGGWAIFDGSVTATVVTIHDNDANGYGGGIDIHGGSVRLSAGTIADNHAGLGGGIYYWGGSAPRLANVTMSGNGADFRGGGIYVKGGKNIKLASCTVADNYVDPYDTYGGDGGGLYLADDCVGACAVTRAYVKNTIVSGNHDGNSGSLARDCWGEIYSDGYNLIGVADSGTLATCHLAGSLTHVMVGVDPKLSSLLNDNGGVPVALGGPPPLTRKLLATSPAIDGGDPAGCTDYDSAPLDADERTAPRAGVCDLGAFEYGSHPAWNVIFEDGFESGNLDAW